MTRIIPTLTSRSLPRLLLAVLVAGVLLVPANATHAAGTPEQKCQKGRYSAAAQYSACQQKALARFFGGGGDYQAASGKCRTKYAAMWPKLTAKAPGSTCDTTRFTDNGATVTDNLTGLQWEKKQNLNTVQNFADPHDADNLYTWSASPSAFVDANGTAFTTFLPALNSGGCLAGQCDWRLPTIAELQTILLEYPCTTSPCVDTVFTPTVANAYWSATTFATDPRLAWYVSFFNGSVGYDGSFKDDGFAVRAVRAGL